MILYFPVSSLVTLFGNVLQNPLDPRAKSDTRLMNLVVTFLSTLGQEAETGGVHRMLGVCSEFERIAKALIDKTEKDASSAAKRKRNQASAKAAAKDEAAAAAAAAAAAGVQNSSATYDNSMGSQLSPKFNGEMNRKMMGSGSQHSGQSPALSNAGSSTVGGDTPGKDSAMGGSGWPAHDPSINTMQQDFGSFYEMTGFGQAMDTTPPGVVGGVGGNGMSIPGGGMPAVTGPGGVPGAMDGGFQPLLPQDLWQLPMTLDWDWAETLGGAYPSFENGSTMQGQGQQQQHQGQQ